MVSLDLSSCSFDEFVGEKVVSPSYSSAILGPPLLICSFSFGLKDEDQELFLLYPK